MDFLSEDILKSVQQDEHNMLVVRQRKRKYEQPEDELQGKVIVKPHKRRKLNKKAIREEKEETRRLDALRAKKDKIKERDQLIADIAKTQLTPDEMKFFQSTSKLGHGGTSSRRQKVRQAVFEEKHGLNRSDPSVLLVKERKVSIDTSQRPENVSQQITTTFLDQQADLLEPKPKAPLKKKKKPRVKKSSERKTLFTYIESDSDSEDRPKEDSDSEEVETHTLGTTPAPKPSTGANNVKEQAAAAPEPASEVAMVIDDEITEANGEAPNATRPETEVEIVTPTKQRFLKFHGSQSKRRQQAEMPAFCSVSELDQVLSPSKSSPRPTPRPTPPIANPTSTATLVAPSVEASTPATPVMPLAVAPSLPPSSSVSSFGFSIPDFNTTSVEERKSRKLTWAPGEVPAADGSKPAPRPEVPLPDRPAYVISTVDFLATPTEEEIAAATKKPKNPAYYVLVNRTEEVERSRGDLPIIMEEHHIVEQVKLNDFIIICGETGSGKTTQVPQFLYEAGYGDPKSNTPGMIGVTEPRRVAAVSTAQRVAFELNQPLPALDDPNSTGYTSKRSKGRNNASSHVGYQIRYDGTVTKDTRIKFMTDGILLREIQNDFLLNKYSAILIDEAHERTMNTDILLGLLCRIVPLRRELYNEVQAKKASADAMDVDKADTDDSKAPHNVVSPLKLIIMSATLRVSDFTSNKRMFPGAIPPVINIGSRQYSVTVHFNRKTTNDYVNEAFKKVTKIHSTLPPGGVLVFLTGQQEVEQLCELLNDRFAKHKRREERAKSDAEKAQDKVDQLAANMKDSDDSDDSSDESEEEMEMTNPEDLALKPKKMVVDELLKQQADAKQKQDLLAEIAELDTLVLPLFSMLAPAQQMKVFGKIPEKTRLIVVATNIAETSLTIPGISYVVDCGRVKQKVYDRSTGMSSYVVSWTSQASANQRAGRAGRTGPGHCYRLFSSAVYQELPQHSTPDIMTIPIEGVVLQMKNMGIAKIVSFPFPTPPDLHSVHIAHKTLTNIGALEVEGQIPADSKKKKKQIVEASEEDYKITPLGKSLVDFPVHPRFAKMLVLAQQGDCLDFVIAIVAVLAVGDPFLHETKMGQTLENKRTVWSQWMNETSDLLVYLAAVGAYEFAPNVDAFCQQYKLHPKLMKEIHQLRVQLTNIINSTTGAKVGQLKPPTREQKLLLRQIIAAGFVDHIAKRIPEVNDEGEPISGKWKYAVAINLKECRIHPSSFLYKVTPEYVAYNELIETSDGKCFMRGVTAISLGWMASLGLWLCRDMDKVLPEPKPRYDAKKDRIRVPIQPYFMHVDWQLPMMMADMTGLDMYKYFAQYFLEGLICPEMKDFQQFLTSKPILITTSWAQNKIAAIVQPLLDHKIDSKEKLEKQWTRDPKFWLSAVALWIDQSQHSALQKAWPFLNKSKQS